MRRTILDFIIVLLFSLCASHSLREGERGGEGLGMISFRVIARGAIMILVVVEVIIVW